MSFTLPHPTTHLSLQNTLQSGQSFRFSLHTHPKTQTQKYTYPTSTYILELLQTKDEIQCTTFPSQHRNLEKVKRETEMLLGLGNGTPTEEFGKWRGERDCVFRQDGAADESDIHEEIYSKSFQSAVTLQPKALVKEEFDEKTIKIKKERTTSTSRKRRHDEPLQELIPFAENELKSETSPGKQSTGSIDQTIVKVKEEVMLESHVTTTKTNPKARVMPSRKKIVVEAVSESSRFGRTPKASFRMKEGIRVLQQDPWECLFSFICSANNNIKRITGMVNNAARWASTVDSSLYKLPVYCSLALDEAGNQVEVEHQYYPFPPPSVFTRSDASGVLRKLGFGYRAEYICRSAELLCAKGESFEDPREYLSTLRESDDEEYVRGELLQFSGVGRKVADCVMLMSLGFHNIVPIDVHMYRLARRIYGFTPTSKARGGSISRSGGLDLLPMNAVLYEEVSNSFRERWSPWSGWMQAILFASNYLAIQNPGAEPVKEEAIKDEPVKWVVKAEVVQPKEEIKSRPERNEGDPEGNL